MTRGNMITDLHNAVSAVAPIDGVSIGKRNDRTTWRVDFKPEATAAQRVAALHVVATFDELASLKRDLIRRLDEDAERVRSGYTSTGAGMAMTYQEKFAQAQAVAAMGRDAANGLSQSDREAQFPTLSASVGIEAANLADAADLVLTKYAEFAQLSLRVERVRLGGKAAIKAATTAAEAETAYRAVVWTLN